MSLSIEWPYTQQMSISMTLYSTNEHVNGLIYTQQMSMSMALDRGLEMLILVALRL
jgi:hypothetical protein